MTLVAWWPLHDDSAQDYSGNGNHGTPNGGPTTGVAGRGGLQATSFDGSDDYIQTSAGSSVNFGSSYTFAGWFRPQALTGGLGMGVSNNGSDPHTLVFPSETTGSGDPKVRWRIDSNTNTNTISATSTEMAAGSWYHVVARRKSDGTRTIHVNATQEAASQSSYSDNSASYFFVGGEPGFGDWYSGSAADVRVYSRALSDAEIQTLYEWGSADLARPPTDGVARYPLDGDATDAWGSNDGSATGVAYVNDSIRGQAGQFEAANSDRVATTNFTELESDAFTIATWAKVNDQNRFNGVIVQRSNNQGTRLGTDGDSPDGAFNIHDTSGNVHRLKTSGGWPEDEWVFLVGVKSTSGMGLYLNGELVSSNSDSFTPLSTGATTYIGANHERGSGYLDGLIDDVRIYDYALTPSEVHDLYRWGTFGRDLRSMVVTA